MQPKLKARIILSLILALGLFGGTFAVKANEAKRGFILYRATAAGLPATIILIHYRITIIETGSYNYVTTGYALTARWTRIIYAE
jgi:hypothetical protein